MYYNGPNDVRCIVWAVFLTWQWACKLGDLQECWPFIIEIKARYISLTKKYLNKTKKTCTICYDFVDKLIT